MLRKPNYKKFSNVLLFSISLIPLIFFIYIVISRISIGFVIEWGEGAGINQINHILNKNALYIEPSINFAPLVYTPLYYYLSAGLTLVIKNILFSARLVSVLATLASLGIIALIVYRETKNALIGWVAGSLYLACFSLSGGFYDLARVDSLYVFLLLITLLVFLTAKNKFNLVIAGLLVVIGFFTKQSSIIVFFPIVFYCLANIRKVAWPMGIVILLGLLIPIIVINNGSNGWFLYYIFDLPREHGYSVLSAAKFWIRDIFEPLGIVVGFGLFYFVSANSPFREKGRISVDTGNIKAVKETEILIQPRLILLLFSIGSIGAAWITRASNGGGANNAMSAYAALALLFGIGAGKILNRFNENTSKNFFFVATALICIQFIGLIYNPFNFIPTRTDIDLNQILVHRIEDQNKQVLIPYRSYLPEIDGKDPQIHMVNLFELTGYFKGEIQQTGIRIVNQIREKICYQDYGLIVLDQPVPWFTVQLESSYEQGSEMRDQHSELMDWQKSIDYAYFPKEKYDREKCLISINVAE